MSDRDNTKENSNYNLVAAVFVTGLSGIAALSGFSIGLEHSKAEDIKNYEKALTGTKTLRESPVALARRAFFWGSVCAISGCGLIVFGTWKIIGSPSLEEFRAIVRAANSPMKNPMKSAINDATDFLKYIIEK